MQTRPLAETLAPFLCADASAALAPHDALASQFCSLTDAANRALEVHDYTTASKVYAEALTEAERLFEFATTVGGPSIFLAPMVHTIACQNAAQARKRVGDYVGALELHVRALERLFATAESPASPLALRVNCVRHIKYALAFLAEDLTVNEPDKDSIQGLVARAGPIAAKVMRIAELALTPQLASQPAPPHSDADTCRRVLS